MDINQYAEIFRKNLDDFYTALDNYLFQVIDIASHDKELIIARLLSIISEDISALIKGDPSARHNTNQITTHDTNSMAVKYVLNSYASLNAVIMYRVAHFIYNYSNELLTIRQEDFEPGEIDRINGFLQIQARKLSEKTKASTGVEIHPAAKIGLRFVIDHGYGTVIGETCEIGNDCYILQGVTLGADGIKGNKEGRRHPKLGSNVEIAGFARVFGKIEIGDNTKICGYAVINRDLPPNSIVSIVNQIQVVSPNNHSIVVYGLRPKNNGIEILGRNLGCCIGITILDQNRLPIDSIHSTLTYNEDSLLVNFNSDSLSKVFSDERNKSLYYHYTISIDVYGDNILIQNSIGWRDFVNEII